MCPADPHAHDVHQRCPVLQAISPSPVPFKPPGLSPLQAKPQLDALTDTTDGTDIYMRTSHGIFLPPLCCRPCPIGLSVAQVVAVEGRTLVLGGADIVDGSPVLDIKPFVPFCDNVPAAAAPPWVAAEVTGPGSVAVAFVLTPGH